MEQICIKVKGNDGELWLVYSCIRENNIVAFDGHLFVGVACDNEVLVVRRQLLPDFFPVLSSHVINEVSLRAADVGMRRGTVVWTLAAKVPG